MNKRRKKKKERKQHITWDQNKFNEIEIEILFAEYHSIFSIQKTK